MPAPYSPFLIELGPLQLRWYSALIVAGIALAVWLTRRQLVLRGYPPALAEDAAFLAVPFGIIGARLYHVLTTLDLYRADPWRSLRVWEGGLGIYGAVAGGVLGVWLVARRHRVPATILFDAIAPGLILAQAIGRWGNYFNQEIFGPPTNLPWGLYVDAPYRPSDLAAFERFHPTFLYESLWDLAIGGLLLWLSRRYWRHWLPGTFTLLYLSAYSLGRLGLEFLKVDDVLTIFGVRFNVLVSLTMVVVFGLWFLLRLRQAGTRPFPVGPLLTPAAAEATAEPPPTPAGATG